MKYLLFLFMFLPLIGQAQTPFTAYYGDHALEHIESEDTLQVNLSAGAITFQGMLKGTYPYTITKDSVIGPHDMEYYIEAEIDGHTVEIQMGFWHHALEYMWIDHPVGEIEFALFNNFYGN
jgi:hypothetical protein